MPRLPDWDRRLAATTVKHMRLPGEWGTSDCLATVCDAIEAVTGEDPLAPWRGRYKTEKGAAKLMRKEGCFTVDNVFRKVFKLEPVTKLFAQRGDVGTVMQGGEVTAAYVTEHGVAAKGPNGLIFYEQTKLITAFAVGR